MSVTVKSVDVSPGFETKDSFRGGCYIRSLEDRNEDYIKKELGLVE